MGIHSLFPFLKIETTALVWHFTYIDLVLCLALKRPVKHNGKTMSRVSCIDGNESNAPLRPFQNFSIKPFKVLNGQCFFHPDLPKGLIDFDTISIV